MDGKKIVFLLGFFFVVIIHFKFKLYVICSLLSFMHLVHPAPVFFLCLFKLTTVHSLVVIFDTGQFPFAPYESVTFTALPHFVLRDANTIFLLFTSPVMTLSSSLTVGTFYCFKFVLFQPQLASLLLDDLLSGSILLD